MSSIPLPFAYTSDKGSVQVFEAETLKAFDPAFFYGTSKTIRKIVARKSIPPYSYFYALKSAGGWKASDANCYKAKLLLTASWARQHIPRLRKDSAVPENDLPAEEFVMAPDLLILDDSEKFIGEDGNPIELETRGERHPEKILFKLSDVSKGFGVANLNIVVLNSPCYVRGEAYVMTLLRNDNSAPTKHLFLTYQGILRVLFTTRNGHTDRFVKWAVEKLFVIQMGTPDDKQALASDLLGVSVAAVKQVFRTTPASISCVYLFTLGTVGDLRRSMGGIPDCAPDDWVVCKYGNTGDLERRANEHLCDFKRIAKVSLRLKYCAFVDPTLAFEAEVHIKEFFTDCAEKYDPKGKETFLDGTELSSNRHEVVIISPNTLRNAKRQFTSLHRLYCGASPELIRKIQDLHTAMAHKDDLHKAKEAHLQQLVNERTQLMNERTQKLEAQLEMMKMQNVHQKEIFSLELRLKQVENRAGSDLCKK